MSAPVDFDLGGVLGVRLLDAGPREVAAVRRQLGPIQRELARAPDVCVRFVERIEPAGTLRYVGLQDAAFDDRSFLVLRGKAKSRLCAEIPFQDIGGALELRCERGLASVPLLVPILNATLLAKGHLPLHASAFVHQGTAVVATGWSKGGKTETLLAFMARGARYVADEWLYLAPGGARMFGIPEPIRLWHWHFASLPELRARVSTAERTRLALLGMVAGGMSALTADGVRHGSLATRTLNRATALVRTQLCVDLPPAQLFPDALNDGAPVRPQRLLFVVSHERPEITVEPLAGAAVAERMCASLAEEDQRLVSCYHRFRFAFPERRNAFFEAANERRRELLHAALDSLPAYEVRHPYPVALPALYEAVAEVCR